MTDHFIGNYEIEVKFRVMDAEALRQRLQDEGVVPFVLENRENDCYFERDEQRLKRQNLSMLLRTMEPSGIQLWIVKGPGADNCKAVKIESVSKARDMLQTLGYRPAFYLEKIRSIYFLDQFHITLDHLPGLGDFAEIAVMTDDEKIADDVRRQCVECARRLGLVPEQLEPRSYRQLLGH